MPSRDRFQNGREKGIVNTTPQKLYGLRCPIEGHYYLPGCFGCKENLVGGKSRDRAVASSHIPGAGKNISPGPRKERKGVKG